MKKLGDNPFLQGREPNAVFARNYLKQSTDFAVIVLHSYSVCVSLDYDLQQNIQLHDNWKMQLEEASSNLTLANKAVARLREPRTHTAFSVFLAWLRMDLWPYLLITAIALKFGKGISAFRGTPANQVV